MNYNKLTKKQLIELLEQHDKAGHRLIKPPKVGVVYEWGGDRALVLEVNADANSLLILSMDEGLYTSPMSSFCADAGEEIGRLGPVAISQLRDVFILKALF